MLVARINGQNYDDAISISVARSMRNFNGRFAIQSSANELNALPVKIGDSVEILADGVIVFNGYIDALRMNYSSQSHTINITGRDRTSDFTDSSVKGDKSFQGPISFEALLRDVLDNLGLTNINIVNEVGEIEDFTSADIVAAEVGQSAFDFIEKYARKRQFILTTNEEGNIAFIRASNERLGADLIRLKNNPANNILSASLSIDNEQRFNQYVSQSQLNPYNIGDGVSVADIVQQRGQAAIDDDIRQTRFLEFNSEQDEDETTTTNRAKFEANIRRANSIQYNCIVQGHTVNGSPFKINRLAFVNDDFADISSDMLVYGVNYTYSLETGSRTELSLTYPDAFSLNDIQQNSQKARSKIGDEF